MAFIATRAFPLQTREKRRGRKREREEEEERELFLQRDERLELSVKIACGSVFMCNGTERTSRKGASLLFSIFL